MGLAAVVLIFFAVYLSYLTTPPPNIPAKRDPNRNH